MLLRRLKALERAAGRRVGVRWGPRPLDIDIIADGGRVVGAGWRRTSFGRLVIPHPGMAQREFVLEPMVDVAPHWRHPRTGDSVREMRLRLGSRRQLGLV